MLKPNKKNIEPEDKDEYQEEVDNLCDMFGLEETELFDLLDEFDMDIDDIWI